MRLTALAIVIAGWLCTAARAADLTVTADFPGGAAEVVKIDRAAREIEFKIPGQPNGGWQTWWCLKVANVTPGETLRLRVTNGQAPALRAVYSTDRKTWAFTAPIPQDPRLKGARYEQKVEAAEAFFAWYVPYLPADAKALADRAGKLPFVTPFELCESEGGIPVVGLTFAEGEATDDRPAVWVQARQHAWEAGGSWAAHGLAEWLMSDDDRAKRLRRTASITIVPIMDVDSVQHGRGGKEQKPHDHNRDWADKEPHWTSVRAAQARLKAIDANGRLGLFLDLHDPGWVGRVEFWCHTYNTMGPVRKHNTDLFLAAAKTEITGPLAFDGKPSVKYALTTPTSGIWASSKTREKVVGGTFEIGVAPPKGFDGAPPDHHLTCGKQIGLAIERYLADPNRKSE